jgi:hypothetical protein
MTEERLDELGPSAFAIAYRMLGSWSTADHHTAPGGLGRIRPRKIVVSATRRESGTGGKIAS